MKKALFFLLILSLALSGTQSSNQVILTHITKKLQILKSNITYHPHLGTNTSKHYWECKDLRVFLKELAGILKDVETEHLTSDVLDTLENVKQDLQTYENWFLQGKHLTLDNNTDFKMKNASCPEGWGRKGPLESYMKVLRCFNRICHVTSKHS